MEVILEPLVGERLKRKAGVQTGIGAGECIVRFQRLSRGLHMGASLRTIVVSLLFFGRWHEARSVIKRLSEGGDRTNCAHRVFTGQDLTQGATKAVGRFRQKIPPNAGGYTIARRRRRHKTCRTGSFPLCP